jgi:tricorn protease
MWWKKRVYFVCDRDGTMNIWSMNEQGRDLKQHTEHSGWDVKSPSLHDGRIVYQLGADIWLHDIQGKRSQVVPIALASDFDQLREKWVSDPMQYVTSAHLHPEGEAIVLTSRGRVFVAPAGKGRLVQASRKEGIRYRDVVFMPDGETLIGLSDETGEFEFVTIPANGVGLDETLTADGEILRYSGEPSPDGKWLAYKDRNSDFWLLNIQSREQRKISPNREGIQSFSWSPDSLWIAYSLAAENTFFQVHLYSVTDATSTQVTSDRINSISPAWGPKGKSLYFLSDRNLTSVVGSPWGPRQPEPFFDKPVKLYHVALKSGTRSPFSPPDEVSTRKARKKDSPAESEESTDKEAQQRQDSEKEPKKLQIDTDGIHLRVKEIPVPAGEYRGLSVGSKALFWLSRRTGSRSSNLMAVEISNKDPKPKTVIEGLRSYELSGNRKKILIFKNNSVYVAGAAAAPLKNLEEAKVDLGGWAFPIDVREDFRQLFIDAWRMERDFFYDPAMHGVDWDAVRDKYLPLVDRVTTRAELSDLIGEVVGELSALHVSVRGGDHRRGQDQIRIAKLGARLRRDEGAGGFRITYIYQSDPDYPKELSPLADPDLGIQTGDIIQEINGTPTLSVQHPYALLRKQDNKQVLLKIASGRDSSTREVVVIPTSAEASLRGYVHLRAMGGGNLTEWYRNFYPVFNRKGLIIDVRHNRGGNIDSLILEKLMRSAWFYFKPRTGSTTWNMQYAFRGHMVVLCDQLTASDGEAFAEGFRRLGLGKLIGTRTWGGEIWLSSNNLLTDRGLARAPQTGVYGEEREWLIEGHGVDPDIVVDNLPHATFKGKDSQLEAAIQHLQDLIAKDPRDVPEPPAYPDKSFQYPKR